MIIDLPTAETNSGEVQGVTGSGSCGKSAADRGALSANNNKTKGEKVNTKKYIYI